MKLKTKPSQLEQVVKILDKCGIQYARAKVEAKDNETGKSVQMEVVMGSFCFHAGTGAYLFSGPTVNPAPPGSNHKS